MNPRVGRVPLAGLIRGFLFFTAASCAFPQALAVLKPDIKYGDVQIWNVELLNHCSVPVTVARAAVMLEAPGVSDLPNDLAKAHVLAGYSRKSFWMTLWGVGQPVIGTAAAAYGASKKSTALLTSGAVLALAGVVFNTWAKPIDPSPYLVDLMPESVTLAAGAGAQFGIVARPGVRPPAPVGPFSVAGCGGGK